MAETIHVRGEGGAVWEMDLPLPDGVAQRLERGDLARVNEDGSPYEEPADEVPDGPPAKTASKAEWVAYASRWHDNREELEGMTKAELIKGFGG